MLINCNACDITRSALYEYLTKHNIIRCPPNKRIAVSAFRKLFSLYISLFYRNVIEQNLRTCENFLKYCVNIGASLGRDTLISNVTCTQFVMNWEKLHAHVRTRNYYFMAQFYHWRTIRKRARHWSIILELTFDIRRSVSKTRKCAISARLSSIYSSSRAKECGSGIVLARETRAKLASYCNSQ